MTPDEKEIKENWQIATILVALMIFVLTLAFLIKNKNDETKTKERGATTYTDAKINFLHKQ